MTSIRTIAIAAVLLALPSQRAFSQAGDYPNHPVTFVVPFAPGGVTGLFARLLGQKLEQRLGKPFVVDHRPGGGGITAAAAVARSAPDGYTIMMASSTILAFNVTVRKELAYDPRKDLTPIALLARVPFVLVVNPALPVKSVEDRQAREGKAGAGVVRVARAGNVSSSQRRNLQEPVRRRTYSCALQGPAPALQDIAAGHVSFMFADVPPARGLIEGGKLRALGVTTAQRVAAIPDVPPLAQAGMPGYDASSWHTITTTGGVPNEIVDKLYMEIRSIMAEREVQNLLSQDGTLPQVSPPPDEMKKFVSDEIVRWGEVITRAGIAGSQ